jgi:hypothetical protein
LSSNLTQKLYQADFKASACPQNFWHIVRSIFVSKFLLAPTRVGDDAACVIKEDEEMNEIDKAVR